MGISKQCSNIVLVSLIFHLKKIKNKDQWLYYLLVLLVIEMIGLQGWRSRTVGRAFDSHVANLNWIPGIP